MIIRRKSKKIPTHYGMKDYFNFFLKNTNNRVSRNLYSNIVSDFNNEIIDKILNDSLEYIIPHLDYIISVRKDKRKIQLINGKIKNTSPVDWTTTRKLWNSDNESKEKKILVRYLNNHTSGYVFRIQGIKWTSKLKNKNAYNFKPSRKFQRALAQRIKDENKDKFDCYLMYQETKK